MTKRLSHISVSLEDGYDAYAREHPQERFAIGYRGEKMRWPARMTQLAIGACLVLISGCAYFSPYISLRKDGDQFKPDVAQSMPFLRSAIAKIDSWIDDAHEKRASIDVPRRSLNLLTFGLLGGLAATSTHGHHVNSVRNLALGAGASYAGTTLFLPVSQVSLYTKTTEALVCIRDRGAPLRDSVIASELLVRADGVTTMKEKVLRPAGCSIQDPQLKRAFDEAQQAISALALGIRQAQAADGSVATKLEAAARNVLQTLANQIEAQNFSGEALLNAAKSVSALAVGLVPTLVPSPTPVALDRDASQMCSESSDVVNALKANFVEQKTLYTRVNLSLVEQINAIASLDTACPFAPAKVDPITLSQNELNVNKDTNVNVTISGGMEPYRIEPIERADDIEVQFFPPRIINVRGMATTKPGRTYTYRVLDRAAVTMPVTLTISTK